MSISPNLAMLNKERYETYQTPFNDNNAKQAILAFKGDVYVGLETDTLNSRDLQWAQKHLRILSGLYGILRPLDLIQAYRLEMGTKLKTRRGKNLYDFWNTKITDLLNDDASEIKSNVFINLASKEYFKALQPKGLNGKIYDINFLEFRNGKYQFISFTAKKARGWMCRYIIKNRITQPKDIKGFSHEGFIYNPDLSSEYEFIFTR